MKTTVQAIALALLSSCVDQTEDPAVDTVDSEVTATAGTTYQLVNQGGQCLDVPNFARTAVALQTSPCKRAAYLGNQQFTLEAVTGGHKLRGFDSQLCLDLPNSATVDGTIVQQSQCHNGRNQIWVLRDETYGYVHLTPALDGTKCMHVDANRAVRIARCATLTVAARSWAFGPTRTHASLRQGSQCLDLAGYTTASGASPQLFGCKTAPTNATNQEWALEPVAAGTFRLRSQSSGKCFDLRAGSLFDSTVIEQQPCATTNAQKWQLVPQTASTYKLRNVASGKCADFYNAALRQYTCSSSWTTQLFDVQSGASSMLPSGAAIQPASPTPLGLLAVDPTLPTPAVSGLIMNNAIVVNWTLAADARVVEQRVFVDETTPGVAGGTGRAEFRIPGNQRSFWVAGLNGRSLVAGRTYNIMVMATSETFVSRFVASSVVNGVLPAARVRIGTQLNGAISTPTIVDTIAFFDSNGNGIVDGAPAGNGTFPRLPGPVNSNTVLIGNQFASDGTRRANAIVGYTLLEGSRRTFVANHLFIDPITGAAHSVAVFYGDLDSAAGSNVWSSPVGSPVDLSVIPSDGVITPNILIGTITAPAMANDGTMRVVDFDFLLAVIPS